MRRGNSNGLFHRPHRPRRATLLAVPEQEACHRAAGDVADRRPAPPGWGPGDGGAARVDEALAGNQELQSDVQRLDSGLVDEDQEPPTS